MPPAMPHQIPTLEYPEVQAHLSRLKAEHKRLLAGGPATTPAVRRHITSPAPQPNSGHTLTLSIPLTPDTLRALIASAGKDWKMNLNAAKIEISKHE